MPHTAYKNKNGKRVPSVTTIISNNLGYNKRILLAWQAREFRAGRDPDEQTERACSVGTLVHEMIEAHIYGQDEYTPPEGTSETDVLAAIEGLQAYIKWEEENNVEYLESEIGMVSETWQYGGTADAIALVNGVVTLIDFKTSRSVYAEHIVQLGAYMSGIEETTDYKIEQCMVIKVDKNAEAGSDDIIHPYKIPLGQIVTGWEVFQNLLELHESNKILGKFLRSL